MASADTLEPLADFIARRVCTRKWVKASRSTPALLSRYDVVITPATWRTLQVDHAAECLARWHSLTPLERCMVALAAAEGGLSCPTHFRNRAAVMTDAGFIVGCTTDKIAAAGKPARKSRRKVT